MEALPSADLSRLAALQLADDQGAERRLGDLWGSGPAVIVWLRHFG